jgi:hypothetical protein
MLSAVRLAFAFLVAMSFCSAQAEEPPTRANFPEVEQLPIQKELPNPLAMLDGTPVKTKADWFSKRKPELQQLFQYYMYGYAPPVPTNLKAEIVRVNEKFLDGRATKKEVVITFGPEGTPPLNLLVIVPNERSGPAPVFLGINFRGNHTLHSDESIAIPTAWISDRYEGVKNNRATAASRGSRFDTWAMDDTIDAGYALATFWCGDLDPDRPDFTDGVHPHYLQSGQDHLGPHDWGTIAAWAWGVSRAVDYLVTDSTIDKGRIAVVGHSRLGKTTLLAAALDDRIALAIPHQAGCGGTAPSRSTTGESVERINTSFPHWFNDTFPQFNEQVERLPFDQHCLVALVAPRPVLMSNAVEDTWANPAGQFEMLVAADPVYRLLGVEGLCQKTPPPTGKLLNSRLGYYIRPGKHSMTRDDWRIFREFADEHLGK